MDDDPSPGGSKAGGGSVGARRSTAAAPAAAPVPTLSVGVASLVGRLPIARGRVVAIAQAVLRGERCRAAVLAISFVPPATMARLNRRYLGHRGATDIITFEHTAPAPGVPLVGDIYIAPAVAAENARRYGGSVRAEVARLVIHGVLHALGWEHPEGEGEVRTRSAMWRRQERWLARLREDGTW